MKNKYIQNISCRLLFSTLILLSFISTSQVNEFVLLRGNKFKLNGGGFNPKVVNYTVRIKWDNDTVQYVAPSWNYGIDNDWECDCQIDCYNSLVSDFSFIKDSLGCNTIRLTGMPYGDHCQAWHNNTCTTWYDHPVFIAYQLDSWTLHYFNLRESCNVDTLLGYYQTVFDAAKEAGLKVILLVGGKRTNSDSIKEGFIDFLKKTADRFKNEPALFAYDFFNEPAYFDFNNYQKGDACEIVSVWNDQIKNNSLYQLTTIGLAKSIESFKWDPGILNLDFISFHPYPLPPTHVMFDPSYAFKIPMCDMKWYSRALDKPWMIGETSFSASPVETVTCDHGNLDEQEAYLEMTFNQCFNCGGSGFSWWNYQDHELDNVGVDCYKYYWGLRDKNEEIKPAGKLLGTIKPPSSGECIKPNNYFNQFQLNGAKYIIGKVVDRETKQPIEDAVIRYTIHEPYSDNYPNITTYSRNVEDGNPGWFLCCSDESNDIIKIRISAINAAFIDTVNLEGIYEYQLDRIKYEDHITIDGVTIPETGEEFYQAKNSITVKDLVIEGNGTSGGYCRLHASNVVKFENGHHFIANKGSRVYITNGSMITNCDDVRDLRYTVVQYKGEIPPLSCGKKDEFKTTNVKTTNVKPCILGDQVDIQIYPVPNNGIFNIYVNDATTSKSVKILNVLEKVIYEKTFMNNTIQVDISAHPKGMYFVITMAKNQVFTEKIIIQ